MSASLKNTFLEVIYDGGDGPGDESTRRSRATGSPQGSPTALRSRSAEFTPRPAAIGGAQIEKLNFLLGADAPGCYDIGVAGDKLLEDETGEHGLSCPAPKCHLESYSNMSTTASERERKDYCHRHVPRRVDFEEQAKLRLSHGEANDQNLPTTLMLRNVPNCYTQQDLHEELGELGFSGAYNFLYMPFDKSSKASVGYAFVNFLSPSWAACCITVLQGYSFKKHRKNKGASVSAAHLQGLEANLAHYESCALRSAKAPVQPLVIYGDQVLPLPR